MDALLDDLLELEPEARAAVLEQAAEQDPATAAQAEELLRAMEEPDDAFSTPLVAAMPDLVSEALEDAAGDRSGKVLGNYRLLRVLGRGGMGVVYLAERADREYEKQVAIKLMPSGLESAEAERRFRRERQVLARLEHPGIARLLDGGVTEEGYPYLVMELVEGWPIDRYCERAQLGSRARIELFLDVCDAVQYAHQNLVIHRDLKPSNILVDPDSGPEGRVKLLDFGVAKLVEEDEEGNRTLFQPHTPGYAAPEQLANRPVSTASDAYSLGVILQRLLDPRLSERVPWSDQGAIPNPEKDRPSSPEPLQRDAPSRQPRALERSPRGDLRRVIDKALEVEPERRYPTAAALADDLRRYLVGDPVNAREPTLGYRLRRFVGRHRTGVALGLLVVTILTAMLIVTVTQGARARAEAVRSQRIASLLTGLFVDANPWAPTSGEVSVPELLERGVWRVRDALDDDVELRARLLSVLGQAYNGQGQPERGIPLLEEALEARRELFGDDHPLTAESMGQLGYALLTVERTEEATPLVERSVAIAERLTDLQPSELAGRLFILGLLRNDQEDFRAQEAIFTRVVDLLRREGQALSPTLALALGQLSVALDSQGRDQESLVLQQEAVAVAEETLGPLHPYTATLRNNLGVRLSEAGDAEGAAIYYRRALELLDGSSVQATELIAPLTNLGRALLEQGAFSVARPHLERAARIAREEMSSEDFRRMGAEINLATLHTEMGRTDEAEAVYRAALDLVEGRLGPDHPAAARVRSLLGTNLHLADRLVEADRELTAALAAQRLPDQDPRGLDETLVSLGRLRLDQGRVDEARSFLEEALELRASTPASAPWRIAEVEIELTTLARRSGGSEPASLDTSLRLLEQALPADNFRLQRARRLASGSPGTV